MRHMTRFALAVALQSAVTAWGATIVVETTDPAAVADGLCSLVEAIDNANADAQVHADCPPGAGADVIELGTGLTYTLNEAHGVSATGVPEIESEITINGHGSTIQRNPGALQFRLVFIDAAGNLTLNDLTLSNGFTPADGGGTTADIFRLVSYIHSSFARCGSVYMVWEIGRVWRVAGWDRAYSGRLHRDCRVLRCVHELEFHACRFGE